MRITSQVSKATKKRSTINLSELEKELETAEGTYKWCGHFSDSFSFPDFRFVFPLHMFSGADPWFNRMGGAIGNDFIGTSYYLLLEFGIKRNRFDSKMFCQFTHRWLLNRLFVLKTMSKADCMGHAFLEHSWIITQLQYNMLRSCEIIPPK